MSDTLGLNEHGAISTCLLPFFPFGNSEICGERGGYIFFPLIASPTSTPHGIRFLVYTVYMHVFLRIFIASGGSSLK